MPCPKARTIVKTVAPACPGSRLVRLPRWKKVGLLALVNLVLFAVTGVIGEVSFRLFWNPKYYIHCDQWAVGSGMTAVGRKYWPNSTYQIESSEFRVTFRTNAQGYRARPGPSGTKSPYRIAFVGDSFTEGMQVDYDKTFCALIERGLAGSVPGRAVVCENYGVAATDLFEYWHRITHDVLRPAPPDALVLCIFPGNDLTGELPDNGFDADGRPRREYYKEPGWVKHISTWLNLKSKFAFYVQQRVVIAWRRMVRTPYQAPWQWWANPDVTARAADAPVIRRSRALLQAIATECRQRGTKLCILVVGPVAPYYCAKDGKSPLGQIIANWQIDVPVIDIAIVAQATPMPGLLLFPRDGHLNEPGHAFVAAGAIPLLRTALSLSEHSEQIGEGIRVKDSATMVD